ncbi:MAG TPA: glycosyltransferase family 2 protein [Methylomirabilota bacterium]|nr:glycosyltransferase family 2 protein [Methylomirabilota bacterium]
MSADISLVILNYNGAQWLDRCLESICCQTAAGRLEVIITDNGSTDESRAICERFVPRLPALRFINNGKNLWYCEANNIGAASARSPLVFILNNDLWLEPDCVETLLKHSDERPDVQLFSPRVLNYDGDIFQGFGARGLDWLGICSSTPDHAMPRELFSGFGCAFVIRKDYFFKVGAYPPELLIYGDELDLGWRVLASGRRVISTPSAKVHHRGAAVANPAGGTKHVELRTNEMKRFLSVRNGLLLLLKNCQHILLLMLIPHLLMLGCEALFFLMLTRNWKFVRNSYVAGVVQAFGMTHHVRAWRQKNRSLRRHGDFWMLRFLYLKPGRWGEAMEVFRLGVPKVEQR